MATPVGGRFVIAKMRKMRLANSSMNAQQIIDEITQLPLEEKSKVVEFVRHLPNQDTIDAINEPIEDLPRYTNMNEVRSAIKDLVHNA
jgi:hypothetical protein